MGRDERVARKMRPYGEAGHDRFQTRWQVIPGGLYKTSLSEWKRIKRRPKKRARQAAKAEIRKDTP